MTFYYCLYNNDITVTKITLLSYYTNNNKNSL